MPQANHAGGIIIGEIWSFNKKEFAFIYETMSHFKHMERLIDRKKW